MGRPLGKPENIDELLSMPREELENGLHFVALLLFRNEIKPDSRGAIETLKSGKVRTRERQPNFVVHTRPQASCFPVTMKCKGSELCSCFVHRYALSWWQGTMPKPDSSLLKSVEWCLCMHKWGLPSWIQVAGCKLRPSLPWTLLAYFISEIMNECLLLNELLDCNYISIPSFVVPRRELHLQIACWQLLVVQSEVVNHGYQAVLWPEHIDHWGTSYPSLKSLGEGYSGAGSHRQSFQFASPDWSNDDNFALHTHICSLYPRRQGRPSFSCM